MTSGLSSLVYAITQAGQEGWLAAETLAVFGLALALLVGFVAWELRHPEPLMRFGILRTRTVAVPTWPGSSWVRRFLDVPDADALHAAGAGLLRDEDGVAYLAVAGTAIVWSAVASQLVARIGVKPVLVVGMTMLTGGLVSFTQVSVGGCYVSDLLPGFLLIGVGSGSPSCRSRSPR